MLASVIKNGKTLLQIPTFINQSPDGMYSTSKCQRNSNQTITQIPIFPSQQVNTPTVFSQPFINVHMQKIKACVTGTFTSSTYFHIAENVHLRVSNNANACIVI